MSKFKVGDRVKDAERGIGTIKGYGESEMACVEYDSWSDGHDGHGICGNHFKKKHCWYMLDCDLELVKFSTNEIHITTKDNRVITVQKQNGKVVNRAEAICAPSDIFNFDVGARLAFNRLIYGVDYNPTEVKLTPTEDKPQPKYKVGDKVKVIKNALSSNSAKESYVGNVYEIKNAQGTDHVHGTKYGIGEMCVVYEDEIEPYTEPTQEPIKLYCVKDYEPNERLTKGKIYKIDSSGYMHWNSGLSICTHKSADDFFKTHPQLKGVLIPLVARPAKVGEWVYVIKNNGGKVYAETIWKVAKISRFGTLDVGFWGIDCDNYLVLDGYTPKPEYFSGKVVCVDVGNAAGMVVGKVYSVKDGVFLDDMGRTVPKHFKPFTSLEDMNRKCGEHSGSKFIELVED